MGIKYAHQLTHSLGGLSLSRLHLIAQHRFLLSKTQTTTNNQRLQQPTLDVDISWLYRSKNKIVQANRIQHVIDICVEFVRVGFAVILVCDGVNRHHSKRATIGRLAKSYNNSINGYIARSKLMQLSKQRQQTDLISEQNAITEEEKTLTKQIQSLESQDQASKIDVGEEFYQNLCKFVDGIPQKELGNQNGKLMVIQAEYQADSVIAYRLINKISDISFCIDSDIAALTGIDCCSIKSYKYSNKQVSDIELFFADKSSLDYICNYLEINDLTPGIKINISKCAIFDGIKSLELRSLVAVGLGCDVFPMGIRNNDKPPKECVN